jgi:hypothetical protein
VFSVLHLTGSSPDAGKPLGQHEQKRRLPFPKGFNMSNSFSNSVADVPLDKMSFELFEAIATDPKGFEKRVTQLVQAKADLDKAKADLADKKKLVAEAKAEAVRIVAEARAEAGRMVAAAEAQSKEAKAWIKQMIAAWETDPRYAA